MSNNDCGISINGNHTDIAVKVYKNRLFIIVTQFQKFGSMVTVTRESSLDQFNSDTYSTHVIFGKDTEEIHAAVRYIAEAINIDRPLLLSIALKDYELSTLKVIVSTINKLKAW
ncbi:hypothetical protein KQX54_018460 [Cotesia glomerata]|uniref:Proteasome assembly chaperone 3 n=1 Tax=Cotesia glomerata TaxID=32391 RepID=A0AAV7I3P1_COTGL|nr:hypothetical protein KQX54_018460 [Cotesia glomerata]